MNTVARFHRLTILLVVLLSPVSAWAAGSLSIEFDGVVVEGGKSSVSLLDLNTGVAKWVVIGGKFEGYTVTAYVPDPRGPDAVVLSRTGGDQTLRVGLKNAVILEAPIAPDLEQKKQILGLITVGRSQYLGGNLDGAASTFNQLLSLDPGNQEATYFIGQISKIHAQANPQLQSMEETRVQMLREVDAGFAAPNKTQ